MVAGAAGAVATRFGFDLTVVRIALVVLSLASGIGVLAYVLVWLFVPLEGEPTSIFNRATTDRRGIAAAAALLPALVVAEIVASALGVGYVGSFGWPLFLSTSGLVLIWRNVSGEERAWLRQAGEPMLGSADSRSAERPSEGQAGGHDRGRRRIPKPVLRAGGGVVVFLVGIGVLSLGRGGAAGLRPAGGTLLVIVAFMVAFGPWWLRIARDLVAERQARVRAEDRAEMAARVHDSVLQTLALIQRSSDRPEHVVRLARAQERELRSWLFEGRPPGSVGEDVRTVSEGIARIEQEVESDHGVAVQAVAVGDCPLTEQLRALLAAAKEAVVNAAKWSGVSEISLFAEVEADQVTLFVRDRGTGFDPDAVPSDRQGIAESIRGRVARQGGEVRISSSPGAGTEVALSMPRSGRRS